MLTFNLKKEWYEKIRSGKKTIEYREVKSYWTKRIENELEEEYIKLFIYNTIILSARTCILRLGYTKRHMTANITQIEIINGWCTDLHVNKQVYAIHLANVREEK